MLHITPGERSALELLATGGPMAEVAASLGVRVPEVDAHLTSLFVRMGVSGTTEAVAAAWRRGLLPVSAKSVRRAAETAHVAIAETLDRVIVDHPDSLHVRVDHGRSNEAEAAALEIAAERV